MGDDEDRSDLAQERTDLAEDRNIMAVERTFAGWIRTAMASIGIGLGFHALFGDLQPPWLARAIATLFVGAGGALAITAQQRARATLERLRSHEYEAASAPNFMLLGYAVAVGAALLVAGFWIFNDGKFGG